MIHPCSTWSTDPAVYPDPLRLPLVWDLLCDPSMLHLIHRSCSISWSFASTTRLRTFVWSIHVPPDPQILQYILIPCFYHSFEKGEGDKLIGGPPAPDQDSEDNIISVFINRIIDPENPFGTSDAVRILLLQFSSLLVEQASSHIHDAANKYCVQFRFPYIHSV